MDEGLPVGASVGSLVGVMEGAAVPPLAFTQMMLLSIASWEDGMSIRVPPA